MDLFIILTVKQLVASVFAVICLLFVGLYLIIRLWARDRFEAIEERTASLEDLYDEQSEREESTPVEDWFKHG